MEITAEQVMTRNVTVLSPEMTLKEMDRILLAEHISGAPVVERGFLIGVASWADVIRVLYDEQVDAQRVADVYESPYPLSLPSLEHLARDSRKIADHMIHRRVREIMTTKPLTVRPSDTLGCVARMMKSERVHRVPVTENDQLLGILTSLDIVGAVAEYGLGSEPRTSGKADVEVVSPL